MTIGNIADKEAGSAVRLKLNETINLLNATVDASGNITANNLTVDGLFTSRGIDDNATSTALTLDTSLNATFANSIFLSNTKRIFMDNLAGTAISVMRVDTSDFLNISSGGNGINLESSAGVDLFTLTEAGNATFIGTGIFNLGASGATANIAADELVIEHSGAGGVSLLSADADDNNFYFGSPSDTIGAFIRWNFGAAGVTKEFKIATDTTDGKILLQTGAGVTALTIDGSQNATFAGVVFHKSFTVATLPSASPSGGNIFVSDESGGAVPAFSDGTNWRRVTDRAIVT